MRRRSSGAMWLGAGRRQVLSQSHDAAGPAPLDAAMHQLTPRHPRTLARLRGAEGEDGQATVELAIVVMVLVTMVFGALEVGRGLNTWVIVTQSAREGARTAAARCSMDPGCVALVEDRIRDSLVGLSAPESADWGLDPGPYQSGNGVTVWVEYDMVPVTPLIASMIPGGVLTVRGETTMRLE